MRNFILFIIGILFTAGLWSCGQGYKYKQLEKRELASGERHDSLFLGIYFGMPAEEFYTHCWEMNKQRLVKDGPGNRTVQYLPPDFKQRTQMLFFPRFHEDKIHEMPVEFAYEAWAPWNKDLQSDKLQLEVVQVFEKWYGKGFLKLVSDKIGDVYVKMDGNRRISIWREDDHKVKVIFKDMMVAQQIGEKEHKLSEK